MDIHLLQLALGRSTGVLYASLWQPPLPLQEVKECFTGRKGNSAAYLTPAA